MSCTEKCWTAVECPDHGDPMNPFGRSAGEYAHYCCDNYADSSLNPRHLWNEHDSTRWYSDPEGWDEHERTCVQCLGESQILVLDLTSRALNVLRRNDIETVAELCEMSWPELLDLRGFGQGSLRDVISELGKLGLTLKGFEDER